MTHRKTREPDDSAEMTTGYRVALGWPSGRPLVSSIYKTLDEATRKFMAWFIKGYSAEVEDAYCWTITLTGDGSPIYRG
jgi:hypothetical protein